MKPTFLNNPVDISSDFQQLENEYFIPSQVNNFTVESARGKITWQSHRYALDWFFNKIDKHLQLQSEKMAPFQDYDLHPVCDFDISFISQRAVRLRMHTTTYTIPEEASLMIRKDLPSDASWKSTKNGDEVTYKSEYASLIINTKCFSIKLLDAQGKILTETQSGQELKAMHSKAIPFSFLNRSSDCSRSIAASFSLYPGEKIFGCGESFTRLDKRGQKINLYTTDAQSATSQQMYKPIPFFFSSRGYGMFVHTSAPVTVDFGLTQSGTNTIYNGDDVLDIFLFAGSPADILAEYTALTGRSPLPPLWSFGLWMGCFSYTSEKEVREVATKMRKLNFPCDVIHIDSGWFEKGINCDFRFNKRSFPDPEKMIADLNDKGFKISLWQIPYFTPNNPIFSEVVEQKLFIKDSKGNLPTEDAILDFSNPKAIKWYSEKLKRLLKAGVSVIKVDFGEAAPPAGLYTSGRTGFYEHNLYPLRYNKIVSELTKAETGDNIIWARSAWAGSQKYPVHWGGDAEVSDAGMSGSLRAGLSLGLSGFSFWSHDIGGFSGSPVEELFNRWSFFGLMSSHSRVHGFPPREPWKFSKTFQEQFRKMSEWRYRLIPYIYTQAHRSSAAGLPLMKALLLNYPDDQAVWNIEDQYLFGDDLLIAPLMEKNTKSRRVYLPEGKWVHLDSHKIYGGKQWIDIKSGELAGIILVRWGALVPVAEVAQSTTEIDWKNIKLVAFSDGSVTAEGMLFTPGMSKVATIKAARFGEEWNEILSDENLNYMIIDHLQYFTT